MLSFGDTNPGPITRLKIGVEATGAALRVPLKLTGEIRSRRSVALPLAGQLARRGHEGANGAVGQQRRLDRGIHGHPTSIRRSRRWSSKQVPIWEVQCMCW